jgi:predicted RNase H-like nuclease (RuvC/YqgF family)
MNREKKEEIKKLEGLAEWYSQQAKELERQITDTKKLRQEAARHRREARALERKIAQLRGPAGGEARDKEE